MDWSEIEKEVDENNFVMNIINSAVGGILNALAFKGIEKLGSVISEAWFKNVSLRKIKPESFDKSISFDEDLKTLNRNNIKTD